ncbi:LuxR C-terminal-related transcriptional regulator [Rhizobium sp. RAF36]|uniref:LuxR C-terminal-related transcriptional regulator n=1 Tax=Rhizobium sp. RAF36 TaxID=3233055 RepID=UPI003F9D9A98
MLAPLEIGCLRWIAQGKSIDDIALLEGIEKSQVEAHLERAATGLNAKSIGEAVEMLSRMKRE